MICIFCFALFYFTWSYDTGLLRRHLLAMICSTCTVTCWGGKPVFAVGLDTLLMEKKQLQASGEKLCNEVASWRMEELYLYINICTSVYQPVHFVETDRSRDVFLGEGRGSKQNPKDSGAIEMSHEWVPYVKSRGSNYQCAPESALNHHEADGGTTSPLHPR